MQKKKDLYNLRATIDVPSEDTKSVEQATKDLLRNIQKGNEAKIQEHEEASNLEKVP